jgi:hypothetical protein
MGIVERQALSDLMLVQVVVVSDLRWRISTVTGGDHDRLNPNTGAAYHWLWVASRANTNGDPRKRRIVEAVPHLATLFPDQSLVAEASGTAPRI